VPRIPSRKLNVAVHAVGLRNDFPDSVVELGMGRICWMGYLQPTPLSERYRVRIEYSGQARPMVNVISPKLVVPDGKVRLPHVFPGARDLCLHYSGEWNPGMSIAATIVPWASEWLLHYEIWCVTGTWAGGGHEPSAGAKRDARVASEGSTPSAANGRGARTRR
jgi:hypothetical protein